MNRLWSTLIGILNIVLYLVIVATWIALPEYMTLNVSITVVNLAISCFYVILNREKFKKFYLSGQFKGLTSALLSTFLIFVILGFINYLAFKNPIQWDFSTRKKNSVTKQSANIVRSMKGPINIKVFSTKREWPPISGLLDLYRYEKSDISIQFIDVELRPVEVKKYEITQVPSVIFEFAERKEYATGELSELKFTNSLIKIARKEAPLIFYSTGHDELSLTSTENEGGLNLSKLVKKSSYEVRNVSLNQLSEIPSFVKALVIWGPKSGFFDNEIKVIDKYLKQGGKLLIALDPNFGEDRIPKLRKYLTTWGIKISNNLVIDRIQKVDGSSGSVPIVQKFEEGHPVTNSSKGPVFFPLVSSVSSLNDDVRILAQSTPYPASWAETSADEFIDGKVTYNEGRDIKGPVGFMASFEKEGEKTKIMAFGNSSFVINTYTRFPKNFILFVNSLSWLADNENLISFNLPVIKDEPVFVSSTQKGVIFYFSVVFLPLVLFGVSFFFYRRRLKL